mmetsp:Transcript_59383/g.125837  ORF Transcript_59383/g.125837 Transcript_59383/m.125837 type:complete len:375 (+) Transcript_59383:180-1304(+)
MASKVATKRAAAKAPAAAPAQKKAKMDPNCRGVLEAIQMADLPVAVKQMLEASAPKAFETSKEDRHYTQELMVNMVGESIDGVLARLDEELAAITKQVEESKEKSAEVTKEEEKKTAAVTEALQATTDAKTVLKELSESLETAKVALRESQEAQSKGDADLNKSKEDKASTEAVLAGCFASICEGASDGLSKDAENLVSFVETLTLDASLRSALPTTCSKKADVRGGFDNLVIQQTRTCLEQHLQSLSSAIESGLPAAEERASLVASKAAEVEEATKKVEEATQKLAEAESAGNSLALDLAAAQAASKERAAQHDELEKTLQQKTDDVENFRAYNVACFELLKEKTAASAPSPLAASAAAPADEPATTAVAGGA